MKYIKTFEYIIPISKNKIFFNKEYIVGKYVIVVLKNEKDEKLKNFIDNNIGVVEAHDSFDNTLLIKFDNTISRKYIKSNSCTMWFENNEIEYISANRDELETILQTKKYNI